MIIYSLSRGLTLLWLLRGSVDITFSLELFGHYCSSIVTFLNIPWVNNGNLYQIKNGIVVTIIEMTMLWSDTLSFVDFK